MTSKLDFVIGCIAIGSLVLLANKAHRPVVAAACLGAVLPDIIDLAPNTANRHLGLALPTFEPIFPWHFHDYSGSLYGVDCSVSNINHGLMVATVLLILAIRWRSVKAIFTSLFGNG